MTVRKHSAGDCLVRDTRISTADGPVPVQALRPGDRLVLAGGGTAPVVWVGHRRVHCQRHPQPHTVRPVRVQRDAFADGVPSRDLLLSPDHGVFIEGVLIPVGLLAGLGPERYPQMRVGQWCIQRSVWRPIPCLGRA